MSVLLGAIIPYLGATLLVVLLWRFLYVRHPYLRLAIFYLTVFALWHLANIWLLQWAAALPRGIEEWLAASLLYLLGVHFAIGNYTCIEMESPSMILFTLLDEAGPEGLTKNEITRRFRELGHVENRLDSMEGYGLLQRRDDGSFEATRAGKFIRWCFDICFPVTDKKEKAYD